MNTLKATERPVDDTIVRRLDEFPELATALLSGDLPTARMICSRLFNMDSDAPKSPRRPVELPSPRRTR